MKQILSILGSISVIASGSSSIMAMIPDRKTETVEKNDITKYSTNNLINFDTQISDYKLNFKKPDNWDSLLYDICLANNLNLEKFNGKTTRVKNLEKIRNFYNIDDNNLSKKYGELAIISQKKISEVREKSWQFNYTNSSDQINNWITPEIEYQTINLTKWKLALEGESQVNIKFDFNWQKISLRLSGNYEQTIKIKETLKVPSQTVRVSPHSTAIARISVWNTIYDYTGGVKYDINWNKQQFLNLIDNEGKLWNVNIGLTLWIIATAGETPNFTKYSNDLFIYEDKQSLENEKMSFNIPINWESSNFRTDFQISN